VLANPNFAELLAVHSIRALRLVTVKYWLGGYLVPRPWLARSPQMMKGELTKVFSLLLLRTRTSHCQGLKWDAASHPRDLLTPIDFLCWCVAGGGVI